MAPGSLEQADWMDRCDMGYCNIGAVYVTYSHSRLQLLNFNYAPVAVLGLFVIITIWWLVSARHWFKGPIIQGSEVELEAIEHAVGETHLPEGVASGGGE